MGSADVPTPCVIALDLGTTAFKAAAVDRNGLVGPVAVAGYVVDHIGGAVTCDPRRYLRCARRVLRQAAHRAREAGREVVAVGLSSQAQTFIALDEHDQPVAPATVWTDARAQAEAAEAAAALPDFARSCGFARPSPLQFLPKLMRARRGLPAARRFLLLNEWLALELTGIAFGDTVQQGMGGMFDIAAGGWNRRALALAGVGPEQLALVAGAAERSAPLRDRVAAELGLPSVPVYSCGNDQSAAAVGAGLREPGEVFGNFGTAMVAYTLTDRPLEPAGDDQICGISPLPGRWFRLAVESECGNVLEWLARLLYPRGGVARMLDDAVTAPVGAALPAARPLGGGRVELRELTVGTTRREVARALLEYYAERLGELLPAVRPERIPAAGGLSRSAAWLDFLGRRHGVRFEPCATEHPGLLGIAAIVRENAGIG